ncbi:hypothetical protein WUBG_12582 [Wuchereria bancrofti]|uniref:Uncharacterized protein n=1 Tax=Wuchereria bancrofti TaxID=6293 RepID=J9EHM0_WUCBA|nr:hypothetical protein WUBG_12582 [Wuchereria bancrofti]
MTPTYISLLHVTFQLFRSRVIGKIQNMTSAPFDVMHCYVQNAESLSASSGTSELDGRMKKSR